MKGRIFLTTILAIFLFLFASIAFAGGPAEGYKSEVDSARSAQVFAGMTFSQCHGGFNFERWENGEYSEVVSGRFTFIPAEKTVTYLEIYNEVIIDETQTPLRGLPVNDKGEARNFGTWLDCYSDQDDKFGRPDFLAFGYFYKELMAPEDIITITLQPDSHRITIPFKIPKGIAKKNLKMAVDQEDGNQWNVDYCDSSQEYRWCPESGFTFWGNPLKIMPYEIVDISTGIVYKTGTIDPLALQPASQDSTTPINLLFPGGIMEVQFETGQDWDWKYFTNQQMDGEVELCLDDVISPTIYAQIPLNSFEERLVMGNGRTLYKFSATAPADRDATMGSLKFSVLAWSNSGALEFPAVSLYAYTDSGYSTPYVLFDPTGMVAPSPTAGVGWGIPNNEPGEIQILAEKGGLLTIPAGQTLYFALKTDIEGYVPGIRSCAFISTVMEGLGETVLYTPEGCTDVATGNVKLLTPEEASGGSGGAHGPAVPSSTTQSVCATEVIPAKVFFMDLNGGALSVNVGELDGTIEVRQWVEKGEMPIIATGETNQWGWGYAQTQAGYETVVVIITGAPRSSDGFYVSFSRSPYAPPRDNRGGGGKG